MSLKTLSSPSPGSFRVKQTAHGFVQGDVVYLSGASTYAKAQADSAATAEVAGVVSAPSTNAFTLVETGKITGLSGLTAGAVHFLSAATAGLLTATEPSTLGQISKPVLIADTTTSGYVTNMRGVTVGSTPVTTLATSILYTAAGGGLITKNNTTWAEVASALRLTIAATTGDILEVGVNMQGDTANTYLSFDVATVVSGSLTNYAFQSSGANASNGGVLGWGFQPNGTGGHPRAGSILYTVQSGDISSGSVTVTLTCCNSSATGKSIYASAANPLQFFVKNLRH